MIKVTPFICTRQENLLLDFVLIWKTVNHPILCSRLRDVNWRVCHDVLPVNRKLHTQNRAVSDKCPMCKTDVEDLTHIFLLCKFTKPVLTVVESILKDIAGCVILLTKDSMVFNILPPELKKFLPICLLVICMYKDCVWNVRNLIKKERKKLESRDLLNMFLASLKFRFILDFKRLKEAKFKSWWTRTKALCQFTNDKWSFNY